MSAVERITAVLDEAEKRLDAAAVGPWSVRENGGRDYTDEWWSQIEIDTAERERGFVGGDDENAKADADLIVSVVNRERAQIQHARDVLARHDKRTCSCTRWAEDCPEVASLLAVWGTEPTP